MKQELERELTEIVKSLSEAKDFVITQAPDVFQQFILYERIMVMLGAMLILAGIVFTFCSYRRFQNADRDSYGCLKDERSFIAISALFLMGIPSILIGSILFFEKFAAWIAPKWHIVKYFL